MRVGSIDLVIDIGASDFEDGVFNKELEKYNYKICRIDVTDENIEKFFGGWIQLMV